MSFFRYDGSVRNPLGFAVGGCSIAVYTQPCVIVPDSNQVGTPLATIWAASSSNAPNLTSASWSSGFINFTLDSIPSDVVPGSFISISGVNPTGYNGIWLIAAVNGLVVSAAAPNPGAYNNGGTVATSALPNPFTADNLGNYFFYATQDVYTVQEFDPQYNRIVPIILPDQQVVSPGGGTVTSVAITGDGVLYSTAVSGSPITSSGTFAPAFIHQSANLVFASPASGPAGAPVWRQLVAADFATSPGSVSSVDASFITGALFSPGVSGVPITSSGTIALTLDFAAQNANLFFAGPTSGFGPVTARPIVPADTNTAVVDLTAQASSISATTLFTDVGVGGVYVAYVTLFTSTAGSAGSVQGSIVSTAKTNPQTQSTGTNDLTAVGDEITEVITFYAAASSVIQYKTVVTGATGSPKYDIHIRLVFLG